MRFPLAFALRLILFCCFFSFSIAQAETNADYVWVINFVPACDSESDACSLSSAFDAYKAKGEAQYAACGFWVGSMQQGSPQGNGFPTASWAIDFKDCSTGVLKASGTAMAYAVSALPPCPDGQTRDPVSGQCVQSCQNGAVASSGYFHMGTDENAPFVSVQCFGGCEATFTGSAPGARQIEASKYHYYAKGTFYQTGWTCSSSDGQPGIGALPPMSCASGDVPGQVNGNNVCVNSGTGKTTSPYQPSQSTTTNTDNGDGTTTTQINGGDGSTTTIVSGPGGSTTTTEPGPSGGGTSGNGATATWGDGGTGDKQDDQPGICDQYPSAVFCKEKVPIDEEGVPETVPEGFLSVETQKIDDDAEAVETWFTARDWEVSALPIVWNPPIPGGGSCSNWTIYNRVIDICEPLGMARDIWEWFFMVLCCGAIWVRATKVNQGV